MLGRTFLAFVLGACSVMASPSPSRRTLSHPRGCGSDITREEILAAQAHFTEHFVEAVPSLASETVDVPVVFHVIQKNDTLEGGNVPESQLEEQIAVLNADYEATGLTFSLANITRTSNPEWFNVNYNIESDVMVMKKALRQGGVETLNVYLLGLEPYGLLGQAAFPWDYERNPLRDGIILRFTSLPGGSESHYNLGKTLTHEAGHWVGLYHTFQDGCDGGDLVDDTPAEASPASGCPVNRDTCPGQEGFDPIHNYMDYTDDDCLTEFTPGQIDRLRDVLRTYRGFNL